MSNLNNLYRQAILEEANHPRHKGKLENKSVEVELRNPTCGDVITLTALIEDNKIKDIAFDGYGCTISQSSASIMTNEVLNKEIEKIIKQEKIDCDFEKQPSYVFTNEQDEVEKIKLEVKAVNSIGGDSKFVEKTELPFPHLGAIVFPNQAMFHPVKYGKALAQKIIEQKRNDL